MIKTGPLAERYAANYLRKKKYQLLDVNYRTRLGEIDLIFKKKNYIVFVEVKARNENSFASPKEYVDTEKQRKIIAASQQYIAYKKCKLQPRYDVVEVCFEKDKLKSVKHLENAFTLD